MNSQEIKALVSECQDYAVETRRWFHAHPELSNQEVETTKYIIKELEAMGIPYITPAATGVIGVIKGVKPGKVLGIRADIDALPIQAVSYTHLNPGQLISRVLIPADNIDHHNNADQGQRVGDPVRDMAGADDQPAQKQHLHNQ